ncbi:RNA methyltransferase [Cyanobium sp. FGCU-52]|nr:RNA methyltransferase [Cyanobium sp. FGCU52]
MPSALPEQLLLSDLLRRRVRCDQGLDHGPGAIAWMHPPVHRLLGWASRPSAFGQRREVWRLDQLKGLSETEAFVRGGASETDPETLRRLPTLLEAVLLGGDGQPLGSIADAAVELRTGRIRHYLVSRSDPRLPGSSRWRLVPDRIVDQQPGRVFSAVRGLDDLPLARASVRQEFLRRSRRWRDQVGEETARLRDQFQQAGGRLEDRLEGWLEEPPWDERQERPGRDDGRPWEEDTEQDMGPGAYDDWIDEDVHEDGDARPEPRTPGPERRPPDRYRGRDDDDPWV